jgi:glutamate N-acetyltransferase/amino-acid N-acetyltransferase
MSGVTEPQGYRASGVAAGIKNAGALDCALLVSDSPTTVAGTFTTNVMKAPPVVWNQQVCGNGAGRAVFINSGNANACVGPRGFDDVGTTVDHLAAGLDIALDEICVCSTGVIGVPLPMEKIQAGVEETIAALSESGGTDAAKAIMTTDTVPKEGSVSITLDGKTVRIGAMAKGSGMIAPNMATMICVLTTDAAIEAEPLQAALSRAVQVSFNQICVDNDMSTSDTVLCFANGAVSGETLQPDTDDIAVFESALTALCVDMAQALVKDGEGVTKFVEIEINGAPSDEDAKTVARAIAHSHLCKTAFFGEDPNWGRFACAAGYCGVVYPPEGLSLWLDDLRLMEAGVAADYEESDATAIMKQDTFRIRVDLGAGSGSAVFWTSDLSYDYIRINAEYRS